MVVQFTKMTAAGNDFLLMDNRLGAIRFTPTLTAQLCDRHFGVGADGLIALRESPSGEADWTWEFYNSDGSEGEMCGNGARCFARFVHRLLKRTDPFTFATKAGIVTAAMEDEEITVTLTAPRGLKLGLQVPVRHGMTELHAIDTGVPHAVMFVPDVAGAPVAQLGAEIRGHAHFAPRGTNVNFVEKLGGSAIAVRTYERGVEAETMACGTGVAASALVAAQLFNLSAPITARVKSGQYLTVNYKTNAGSFAGVTLRGPAEFVFDGTIEISDALSSVS